MPTTVSQPKQTSQLLNIIGLGLLTGTLDALAALIWNLVLNYKNHMVDYKLATEIVFRFIACGAFGKAAFTGGMEMVVAGVVFHYIIAFVFTYVFYRFYPLCKKYVNNEYLIAVIYGIATWIVMNLLVIPLSKIGFHLVQVQVILIGMLILVVCIGLPIALIAEQHLKKGKLKAVK